MMGNQVAVIHGEVDLARPDEADTMVQVKAVSDALEHIGYRTVAIPVSLDSLGMQKVADSQPAVVFNLVEAVNGDGALHHVIPTVLERQGIPYTGSPGTALFVTSQKPLAKRLLRAAGLPTPDWSKSGHGLADTETVIVKAVSEDASFGLDAASVVDRSRAMTEILARRARFGVEFFAEAFVDGREFNLSLLDNSGTVEVLPPAEIIFESTDESRPRIVDYGAKWNPEDPGYSGTPRSFDFSSVDTPILVEMSEIALECWDVFSLSGYARVDFRVDTNGRPWILEVNANPCLSPDAGFPAAAQRSGIEYDSLIGVIVSAALQRRSEAA